MLFSIIWDVAIEGIHLLEYNWFNSHPPKNSVSDLFPVFLSIEFLLFYPKSHPSCKRAGVFSQERHSSSGSPHMHAPLHAPVTVNDARPSWFFGWTLFFAGACVWFPVVAQISLGMLEKPQRKELTPVLYLLTCRITCWLTRGSEGGKRSEAPRCEVMNSVLPLPPGLEMTPQKRTFLQNNKGAHVLHKSLETN